MSALCLPFTTSPALLSKLPAHLPRCPWHAPENSSPAPHLSQLRAVLHTLAPLPTWTAPHQHQLVRGGRGPKEGGKAVHGMFVEGVHSVRVTQLCASPIWGGTPRGPRLVRVHNQALTRVGNGGRS